MLTCDKLLSVPRSQNELSLCKSLVGESHDPSDSLSLKSSDTGML